MFWRWRINNEQISEIQLPLPTTIITTNSNYYTYWKQQHKREDVAFHASDSYLSQKDNISKSSFIVLYYYYYYMPDHFYDLFLKRQPFDPFS